MSVASFDCVSDEQLLLCAEQDSSRVEAFVARFEERIRACAWRMVGDPNEIDDLTQETVLRILRSLPTFKGESSAATWVYRIAHNTCVDAHRRRAARPQPAPLELVEDASGSDWSAGLEPDTDPAVLLEDALAGCFVQHSLYGLPADYALIASLRLFDGLSNEEIATRLGSSVDSVKSKLKRARAQLRATLAEPRQCPRCPPGEFRFGAHGLS